MQEVLDDFTNEAKEINEYNKWLNYALPLHRCREIGYQNRILDLLDERPLNKMEIQEFVEMMFLETNSMTSLPDANGDWDGFLHELDCILQQEPKQYNPRTKKMEPWINIKLLKKQFSGSGLLFWKHFPRISSQRRRR